MEVKVRESDLSVYPSFCIFQPKRSTKHLIHLVLQKQVLESYFEGQHLLNHSLVLESLYW